MFPVLSRKRLAVAGALATLTAGAVTGTLVAGHASSSPSTSNTAAQSTQATPSPSPRAGGRGHLKQRGLGLRIARVVSTTSNSITVADPSGAQTTFSVLPRTRITGPKGVKETLADLRPGELVVIAGGRPGMGRAKAKDGASPEPTPAAGAPAGMVALAIRDTGFRAA